LVKFHHGKPLLRVNTNRVYHLTSRQEKQTTYRTLINELYYF
jgi:hypothetical protein